jgi:hypothetical protein
MTSDMKFTTREEYFNAFNSMVEHDIITTEERKELNNWPLIELDKVYKKIVDGTKKKLDDNQRNLQASLLALENELIQNNPTGYAEYMSIKQEIMLPSHWTNVF